MQCLLAECVCGDAVASVNVVILLLGGDGYRFAAIQEFQNDKSIFSGFSNRIPNGVKQGPLVQLVHSRDRYDFCLEHDLYCFFAIHRKLFRFLEYLSRFSVKDVI